MKNNKMANLFKKAHILTKEIKKEFKNVDYKSQLGICIRYLLKCKNAFSAFVGIIGQVFNNVEMKVDKIVNFSNNSYGYTLKDNEGNLYKWITKYKIQGKEVLFKRFIIKHHITQNGINYNSIGQCLI